MLFDIQLFDNPLLPLFPLFLIPEMLGFQIETQLFGGSNNVVCCVHGGWWTHRVVVTPAIPSGHFDKSGKIGRIVVLGRFYLLCIGLLLMIEIVWPSTGAFIKETFVVA